VLRFFVDELSSGVGVGIIVGVGVIVGVIVIVSISSRFSSSFRACSVIIKSSISRTAQTFETRRSRTGSTGGGTFFTFIEVRNIIRSVSTFTFFEFAARSTL